MSFFRVAFRVDASFQIGTGHVVRCLTLAAALSRRGAQCIFISRSLQGHLFDLIKKSGHKVIDINSAHLCPSLSSAQPYDRWLGSDWLTDSRQSQVVLSKYDIDWLVVDHYSLDSKWENALRPFCRRLMAIDDLADRTHDCDLLLDQNLGRTENDYLPFLKPGTISLIGPQYALLRPEFACWRPYSITRRSKATLKRLLISMGGVDQSNSTMQILHALESCQIPCDLQITVVLGHRSPWKSELKTISSQMSWRTEVLVGITNMAQVMAESDVAIGAAGGTSWERCAVGLPSLVVVLAPNQQAGADALQRAGAGVVIKEESDILIKSREFFGLWDPDYALKMSASAAAITDGEGANRVSDKMIPNYA